MRWQTGQRPRAYPEIFFLRSVPQMAAEWSPLAHLTLRHQWHCTEESEARLLVNRSLLLPGGSVVLLKYRQADRHVQILAYG